MPTQDEIQTEIFWTGPYGFVTEGLVPVGTDARSTHVDRLDRQFGRPSLIAVISDHPVHGPRSLVYIGAVPNLGRRLDDHADWLLAEQRPDIYIGQIAPADLNEAVLLLVATHHPIYNGRPDEVPILRPMRIVNRGRYFRLLPEVSTLLLG